jgi:hypothetical protein
MDVEVLSLVVKQGTDVTLTTHPSLVPKSRMSRSYTPFSFACFYKILKVKTEVVI